MQVGQLEPGVARVGGERAEHDGVQHAVDHRAVPAGGLAGQRAVVAIGEGVVVVVDEPDDVLRQVGGVASGSRRVEELAAPDGGPRVDVHDQRAGHIGVGEQRVEPFEVRRSERGTVGPHVDLPGEPLQLVDDRQWPVGAGRHVHEQRPDVRVAEGVAPEGCAVDQVGVQAAGQLGGPGRAGGGRDHRHRRGSYGRVGSRYTVVGWCTTGMEIWHNPRCSKSRQARGLLEDAGVTFTERRYLEDVPSAERLAEVLGMLGLAPRELVRTADAKKLGLEMDGLDDDAVIALMAANPRIIERPVVISDDGRAVVGRPPERVNELLGP